MVVPIFITSAIIVIALTLVEFSWTVSSNTDFARVGDQSKMSCLNQSSEAA